MKVDIHNHLGKQDGPRWRDKSIIIALAKKPKLEGIGDLKLGASRSTVALCERALSFRNLKLGFNFQR